MKKAEDKPQLVPPGEATETPRSTNSAAESNPPRSQDESPTYGSPKKASGSGRSALISDLVAQLKRGDITKAELFSRLQQLQGTGAPEAEAGKPPAASGAKVVPTAGSVTLTGASPDTHDPPGISPSLPEGSVAGASHPSPTESAVAESAGFFSAYDRQVS